MAGAIFGGFWEIAWVRAVVFFCTKCDFGTWMGCGTDLDAMLGYCPNPFFTDFGLKS